MSHQSVLGSLLCLGKAHCACMNLLFLKPEEAKGVGGGSPPPSLGQLVGLIINFSQPKQSPLSSSILENAWGSVGTFVHDVLHLGPLKVPLAV